MLDWAGLSLKSLLASWEEWNLLSVILVFWCCYCFGPPLGFIWKKNYNINYVLYHLIYCEVTLLFKALWFQLFFIMWTWRVALGTGCQTVKRVSGSEFWSLHNNRVCFLPLVQHEVGLLALQEKTFGQISTIRFWAPVRQMVILGVCYVLFMHSRLSVQFPKYCVCNEALQVYNIRIKVCIFLYEILRKRIWTHSWDSENVSLSITRLVQLMNCLKLNMKGKPLCTKATKTVWASPFHTSAPNRPQTKWGEQNGPTARTCRRWSAQICPRGSNSRFALWYKRQWSLGSVCLRTAFDLFQECNGTGGREKKKERKKCKRNGRPKRHAHISSLLTGLRVTPGILVKLYVEVSVRVPFKRMKEIG